MSKAQKKKLNLRWKVNIKNNRQLKILIDTILTYNVTDTIYYGINITE